jgi:DNA-directed RNA polymerase subunit beta'
MMRKVTILEPGDTDMLPGQLVDRLTLARENEQIKKDKGTEAEATQTLLGITKASLATESFLSAASFQETTRVLTDAAVSGRVDPLVGLKENVIIGKLIPASTGMKRYRSIRPVYHGSEEEDLYSKLPEAGGPADEGLAESADPGDSSTEMKL